MILLPHLFVLQYLQDQFAYLRNRPDLLEYLLCGYNSCELQSLYGPEFIKNSIEWIRTREIFFVLGTRYDMAKLPTIVVTYEGGSESDQMIGDYAGQAKINITPKEYGRFNVVEVKDKTLKVYPEKDLHKKLWRGLTVRKDKFTAVVDEIIKENDYFILTLNKKPPSEVGLWTSVSPLTQKNWALGSSLDSVTVRIYLQVSGEPELAEMLSTVVRYILKQSRLRLEQNGLYETRMQHSALAQSRDYEDSQVWNVEFSISGSLHDTWVLIETEGVDKIELDVVATTCKENEQDIVVQKGISNVNT